MYLRKNKRLQARLADLDAQIASVRSSAPRRRLRGATLEELWSEWEALDLDEQRAVLADHIDHIDVLPVGRGKRFDPEAVVIHWRGD